MWPSPRPCVWKAAAWRWKAGSCCPRTLTPANPIPLFWISTAAPKTVYGPVFYHEMQLWANRGYFVFFCNPIGSDGRGNRFADIRGHYGETDYRNLMDFTDAVLARYPQIDRKRLAVTGGSYGGFMTNWIIGHTDRFACAASPALHLQLAQLLRRVRHWLPLRHGPVRRQPLRQPGAAVGSLSPCATPSPP